VCHTRHVTIGARKIIQQYLNMATEITNYFVLPFNLKQSAVKKNIYENVKLPKTEKVKI